MVKLECMTKIEIDELEWVTESPDATAKAYNLALQKRSQAEAIQAQKQETSKPSKTILYEPPRGETVAKTLPKRLARLKKLDASFARRNHSKLGVRYGRNPDKQVISANIIEPVRPGYRTVKRPSRESVVLATSSTSIIHTPRLERENPVDVMRHVNARRDHEDLQFMRISPPRASWVGAEQAILPISVLTPPLKAETARARRRVDRIR